MIRNIKVRSAKQRDGEPEHAGSENTEQGKETKAGWT